MIETGFEESDQFWSDFDVPCMWSDWIYFDHRRLRCDVGPHCTEMREHRPSRHGPPRRRSFVVIPDFFGQEKM